MSSDPSYTSGGDDRPNPEDSNPTPVKQETGGKTSEKHEGRTYKQGKATMNQGYNYAGEKGEIGVILTLKSEKLANKVAFTTFIDKMKNYVLTEFEDGKDMMPILEHLTDPKDRVLKEEPTELTPEEAKSEVKRWIKQEKVKQYIKRLNSLDSNKKKLYALIWGQITTGLQEALKGEDEFSFKDSSFDCIWLLEKVKLVSSGIDTKANKYCTLVQALTSFCTIRQGATESNDSFRKRIDSSALTLSLSGGNHMLWSPELIRPADSSGIPTDIEVDKEMATFKAMVMILRADAGRFSELQATLFEGVYKGRDEFPITVTAAYDLLQHISGDITSYTTPLRNGRSRFRRNRRLANFTFTQTSDPKVVPGNDSRVYPHITCRNCHLPGHYANQCPSKKNITLAHFSLTQKKMELINKNWLLLDTCSTISVCCNPNLVNNIKPCPPGHEVTVVTNGGAQSFEKEATLNILSIRVHFNHDSLANILSLSDVANLPGARLTMDSQVERAIILHLNQEEIKFLECSDGLYYWDSSSNKSKPSINIYSPSSTNNLSLTQTVAKNKAFFTKRDVQGADKARVLQSVIGWPSTTKFNHIINSNLINNCPINVDDVKRADVIYAPPLPPFYRAT